VEPIDAGEGFAAAVAVERAGMRVVVVRELRNEANSSTRSREDAEKNAEKNWEK
jgi:hypothetical protein